MRFIAQLPWDTRKLLGRLHRSSQRHRVRARAQCILLSAKGYTTTQLMEIFEVDRGTLYNWSSPGIAFFAFVGIYA